MSTPYNNVFKRFKVITRDYNLESLLEGEQEEILILYLNSAVVDFSNSKTELTKDDTTQLFDNDLSGLEEEIIAYIMAYKWAKQFLNDPDNLERYTTLSPTRVFSAANHIRELRMLVSHSEEEIDRLTNKYEYTDDLFADLG